jgi:hypothetical protein
VLVLVLVLDVEPVFGLGLGLGLDVESLLGLESSPPNGDRNKCETATLLRLAAREPRMGRASSEPQRGQTLSHRFCSLSWKWLAAWIVLTAGFRQEQDSAPRA